MFPVSWSSPVPPLGLPADRSAAAVSASEAGALFAARAGAASPAFELSARNAAAVAQVCTRLDGIPLAIELAAARCPALGPAELAARLDGHPGLPSAVRPARGGTGRWRRWCRGAMSCSMRPNAACWLACWCSTARPDLGTAERVAAGGPLRPEAIAGLLASLAGKSVVHLQDGAVVRYSLLETIRQFAAGRLAASARRRRCTCGCWTGRSARPGPRRRPWAAPGWAAWASRLSAEQDSIRAALLWALGGVGFGGGAGAGRPAGSVVDRHRPVERSRPVPDRGGGRPGRGGSRYPGPGDHRRRLVGVPPWVSNPQAVPLVADGIVCARQAGEPRLEVWGRNLLAVLAWHAGDADRIVAEIEASRVLSGQADPANAARAQGLLAMAADVAARRPGPQAPGSVAGEAARTSLGEAAQPLSGVLAVQDARQQREEVLARRVWAVAASCARAGQRALDAERRLPGDQLGQFPRPLEVRPGRYDLLDQPDPQRLGGAELLGGEQEAHRVAVQLSCAEGGAAERQDPAADLQLAKTHVISGHHDIGGEGKLDRQGVGDAVDGQHHRLGHRVTPDPERIEAVRAAQGARAVPGHHRANLSQVQASRKVIAVPEQHTGAQLLVGAQGRHMLRPAPR